MVRLTNWFMIVSIGICFLCGCRGGVQKAFLPTSTGKPYEVLVVLDKSSYVGEELFATLKAEVPGLPQAEPRMDVSYVSPQNFTSFLRYMRNVLLVEINSSFAVASLSVQKDVWAKEQMVVSLHAPSAKVLKYFLTSVENQQKLIDLFYRAELIREVKYYKKKHSEKVSNALIKQFSIQLFAPEELTETKTGKDFFWAMSSSDSPISLVVYSVPYNRTDAFGRERMLFVRDSVMKKNLPGAMENSYMQTVHSTVSYKAIGIHQKYCVELRGLWEMKNDMMGGPFVSLTRLDEENQCLITAEVFVFAPSQKKRNLLKHAEAMLYTLVLPGENSLPEVQIFPQDVRNE